jgi:hypothetical protein
MGSLSVTAEHASRCVADCSTPAALGLRTAIERARKCVAYVGVLAFLAAVLCAGCSCSTPAAPDAAPADDAWFVGIDATRYLPVDGGPPPEEPCLGTSRRFTIDIGADSARGWLLGARDRIVSLDGVLLRARFLSVDDAREVRDPVVLDDALRDATNHRLLSHEMGFDVLGWTASNLIAQRFDDDGATIEVLRMPVIPTPLDGAIVRLADGYAAVVMSDSGEISFQIVAPDGPPRVLALGITAEESVVYASLSSVDATHLAGTIFLPSARGTTASGFYRFDVDTTLDRTSTVEVIRDLFELDNGYGATRSVVADGLVVGALAVSRPPSVASSVELVWWEPGGAEIARTTLDDVSVEGVGILGVVGSAPAQTLALFTGPHSGSSRLLAGRISAPGVVVGASAPLAIGLGLREGAAWEWRPGAAAIAYWESDGIAVILACEGVP